MILILYMPYDIHVQIKTVLYTVKTLLKIITYRKLPKRKFFKSICYIVLKHILSTNIETVHLHTF